MESSLKLGALPARKPVRCDLDSQAVPREEASHTAGLLKGLFWTLYVRSLVREATIGRLLGRDPRCLRIFYASERWLDTWVTPVAPLGVFTT